MPLMVEKFAAELRERDPASVDTLFLDNSEGGEIGGLNDQLTSLQMLSMVKCGLTTLNGLPSLPALTYLDVSDNKLGDLAAFDILVKNTPELERINLSSNNLSLDNLRTLKMLPKLSELDLSNNEALGATEEYRAKVFEMLPSLKILDGCDVDGDEVEEEFAGEGGEDGEESGEESDGEDGPGLSYLNKSQFSDDETDDYVPEEGSEARGTKRAASEEVDGEEPESKKAAGEEEE